MSKRNSMTTLTRWVLGHKKLVVGLWLVLAIGGFAAIKPAGDALSTSFNIPGSEAFTANSRIAGIYGNGGDVAPIVAVVTLPKGSSVDSPGVGRELTAALAKVKTALPHARLASYASTHDRAFVSKDGRTTFALVSIPAPGGVNPGQIEARKAQTALAGIDVGGAPVRVTGLDALRAAAADGNKGHVRSIDGVEPGGSVRSMSPCPTRRCTCRPVIASQRTPAR